MPKPSFSFGIIADCQYADIPDWIEGDTDRRFRASPKKLKEAIDFFNTKDLQFVVHLGDLIDQDIKSFDTVLPICNQSTASIRQVLGNHDFCSPGYVYGENRQAVFEKMGLIDPYYSYVVGGWRFIVIDGNEVGTIEWPMGSTEWQHGTSVLEDMARDNKINANAWNGGISQTQQNWLIKELTQAEAASQKAIIFAHQSIYPKHQENLLNDEALLPKLASFKHLKAFINGHNHAGNYGQYEHLHCLTMKGMVDTTQNSYALAHVFDNAIKIEGFGREPNRDMFF